MSVSDQQHNHAAGDTEMQNLENIKKTGEKDQELKKILKKLDQNIHGLKKQLFVLVNLYYFFQGAILTAVSQVSSPKCHQWRFFSVLSAIPFLLNGVPLMYTMSKYAEAKNECDMYKLLCERRRVMDFGDGPVGPMRDGFRGTIRYAVVVVVSVFLVGFNATILYGCHSLLCENGEVKVDDVGYDCFSLCNSENKCLSVCTHL